MDTNTMMRRRNLRVVEQLIAELEAKRYDSALTERILSAPGAFPRLLRACFFAQERRFASARADVDVALDHAPRNPVVALAAGMIFYTTRDYGRAIAELERAAELEPRAAGRARQQIVAIASELGWDHDARRAIDAGTAAEPARPTWHAHAVNLLARGRDYARAVEHARRCVELDPSLVSMWMELASLHGRLDQRDEAGAALDQALARAEGLGAREADFRRAAAHVAIDIGDFELARAQLERAATLEPDEPLHNVALAELDSWLGQLDQARAQTELALILDEDCGPALRMRGALELEARQLDAALTSLEAARAAARAAAPNDYQTHLWLAELHRQREDLDAAHAALSEAVAKAGNYLLPVALNRYLLVATEADGPETPVPPSRLDDIVDGLRELCPDLAERAETSRRTDDTVAAVEAALAALGLNRSVQTTAQVDGELVRLHTRSGCRHAARHALMLLRVADRETCLAAFDEVIARYPHSSLPHCHRAELHLWLGNFDQAKADFDHAIELVKGTRWAYIGMSTFGLLEGDYEASLAVNARGVRIMNNTEGPAIHVYRGEAYRRLAKLAKATRTLEAAIEFHPSRASAAINLALTHFAAERDEAGEQLWLRLRDEQARGLLSDAARERTLTIWPDEDGESEEVSRETKIAVLDHALKMMGGNRSSGLLTYWTRESQLRFVPIWPRRGEAPHARDRVYLDKAKHLLLQALTRYSGPRAVS